MKDRRKPNYGIDSPAMVCGLLAAGLIALALAWIKPEAFRLPIRWIAAPAGVYFLLDGLSMLRYSRAGKLRLREMLLDAIPWRGAERVLDVGCGRGLLLAAAARRVGNGKAVGVDVWLPQAVTGNRPESVLENATLEGVRDRVEWKRGDARDLPFDGDAFDVVVSNFVVHEMNTAADREKMLREMVRVLKPGGRLALIDFIFTKECVRILECAGMVEARRSRIGGLGFWVGAVLTLGAFQPFVVSAVKDPHAADILADT